MEKIYLVPFTTRVGKDQLDAVRSISSNRVTFAEHVRRMFDMYLSQPAIQEELRAAVKAAAKSV